MPLANLASVISLVLTSVLAFCGGAYAAQGTQTGSRDPMERCVENVMVTLGRSGAPESQVGPEVISRCDRQLRETLADAIRSGEAPLCTVDLCLEMARSRAASEATDEYRERFVR
jgi:hypothetical protein